MILQVEGSGLNKKTSSVMNPYVVLMTNSIRTQEGGRGTQQTTLDVGNIPYKSQYQGRPCNLSCIPSLRKHWALRAPISSAPLAWLAWPSKPSDSVLYPNQRMTLYWWPEGYTPGIEASFSVFGILVGLE